MRENNQPKKPKAGKRPPKTQPLSKEDALKKMVENDPEKAAAMLRDILNRK